MCGYIVDMSCRKKKPRLIGLINSIYVLIREAGLANEYIKK